MSVGREDLVWAAVSAMRRRPRAQLAADARPAVHITQEGRGRGRRIRLDDAGLHLEDAGGKAGLIPPDRLRHVEAGGLLLCGRLLSAVDRYDNCPYDGSLWVGSRPDARHAFAMRPRDAEWAAAEIVRRYGAAPFPPPPPAPPGRRGVGRRLAAVLRPNPAP